MKTKGNKRAWSFLAGMLPLFMLSSCFSEDHNDSRTMTGPGADTEITFSLQLPGSNQPATRALNETDENAVQAIDVLVFEQGTGAYAGNGMYVYTARCSGTDITTDAGNSSKKTFTVKLRQGSYDLVILTNARSILSDAAPDAKRKWDALRELAASLPAGDKWIAKNSNPGYQPIPMWGDIGNITIDDNTSLTGSNAVKLTRMLARVDVQVGTEATAKFKLSSVRVYNYNTKGSLTPYSLGTGDWDTASDPATPRAVQPNVPGASSTVKGPVIYNSEGAAVTATGCTSEIYLFEAENHEPGHSTKKGLLQRTCLVIGGSYDNGAETFYRMDFSSGTGGSTVWLDVLRNHKYTFSINKVSGAGYATPGEAFESEPVNIEADVLPWNDGEISEVYIGDQYLLAIRPGSQLEFSKDPGIQTIDIKTDYPMGWKIVKITELAPDGITENDITQNGWLTTSVSQGAMSVAYTPFDLIVTENPSATDLRIGYVYIEAGRLRVRITVVQGITQKKTPVFNLVEYINVANPGQTLLPIEGGTISATVESNIAWTLKTNLTGISASYSEPESYIPNTITLSVTIPDRISWFSSTIEVWLESEYHYPGQKFFPTVFTQSGYSVNYISTNCPDLVPPSGGTYDIVFTGECPDFKVRSVDTNSGNTVLWESLSGGVGSRQVTIPSFTNATDRTLSIQYEKNGEWVTVKTVTQKAQITMIVGTPRSSYVLDGSQYSLDVTSNVGWRVEITEDSQGILGGLTNSSGNGNGNFTFTMVNDVQSQAIISGTARLTVYPDVPGLFAPIELLIRGLVYYNTGNGLYFWREDFTNSTWYVFANVPDNVNQGGVSTPEGTQVNPPRTGSCANIDPNNPKRWRIPSRDEMDIIANYVAVNGGAAAFGFAISVNYWGCRSVASESLTMNADYVGVWNNNTQWTRSSTYDLKTVTTNRVRCVSSY